MNAVYAVCWVRQKGKIKKEGMTHVVAEAITDAIALFQQTYKEREIKSVFMEGDDILMVGMPVIK